MTATCNKRTRRIPLGKLDLSRVGERKTVTIRGNLPGDPVGVRIELLREQGWTTQPVKVRRIINGIEKDFATPITLAADQIACADIPEDELIGSPEISIGADAVEAGAVVSVDAVVSWAD